MGRLKTFGDQDTRATVTKNINFFLPFPPSFCFPENREHELFMQMKTAFVVVTGRIHCLFGDNFTNKGPFIQAIYVAATQCNFCRAKLQLQIARVNRSTISARF